MKTKVFFSSIKNENHVSPLDKITKLLKACETQSIVESNELIAIKLHFGELGNTAFIRPIMLRPIIKYLNKLGAKPFLTDTNTVYIGMRSNSVDHIHNANLNGFNYSTLQTPVIIADGLRGEQTTNIKINLPLLKEAKLGSMIVNADGMVVLSHFKGHEISGFGGAIKNLSMGCASRAGKLEMHSTMRPVVNSDKCISCGRCITQCQVNAIIMDTKAVITDKCIGCARCISVCPVQAIDINWNESSDNTQKKMIEYAYAVVKTMKPKIIFINILTSISPACDCYPGNDKPVTEDIGFVASLDPIAIDRASYDLVIKHTGDDPFIKTYPNINPNTQFKHAKEINFGNEDYELIEI